MKQVLLLLYCLLGLSTAHAQPVIDSISLRPESGELVVYGAFSSASGQVTIEQILSNIRSWDASAIHCDLPDSGPGSAGAIVVSDQTGESKPHTISRYRGSKSYYHEVRASRFFDKENKIEFDLRVDLHGMIMHHQSRADFILDTHSFTTVSAQSSTPWDQEFGYNTNWKSFGKVRARHTDDYASGFRGKATVLAEDRMLLLDASSIRGIKHDVQGSEKSESSIGDAMDFSLEISLDEEFAPVSYDTAYTTESEYNFYKIGQSGELMFAPPAGLIRLLQKPSKLSSTIQGVSRILLQWQGSKALDYQVAIVSDSSSWDQAQLLSVSDTRLEFEPSPDVRYDWRVRGTNEFGATDWSSAESFMLPSQSVKEASDPLVISILDNTLRFAASSPSQYSLLDVLGRQVWSAYIESDCTLDLVRYSRPLLLLDHAQGRMKLVNW